MPGLRKSCRRAGRTVQPTTCTARARLEYILFHRLAFIALDAPQVSAGSQPQTRWEQLQTPQGAAAALGVTAIATLGLRALFGSGSRCLQDLMAFAEASHAGKNTTPRLTCRYEHMFGLGSVLRHPGRLPLGLPTGAVHHRACNDRDTLVHQAHANQTLPTGRHRLQSWH